MKYGRSIGKRNVLWFDFKEAREGFCWRQRGRLLHVDGPIVKSLVQGVWRRAYQKQSGH